MTACQKCGTRTPRSRLCAECARDERHSTGPVGGTASDDDEWAVEQTALGDADPAGQTRLDGGIVKADGDGDE